MAILEWLLDRELPREQRLTLLDLEHAYSNNKLEELKASRLEHERKAAEPPPVDFDAVVKQWYRAVLSRSSKDNADRFLKAVRSFTPEGSGSLEQFTYPNLLDWNNRLQDDGDDGLGLSPNGARRYRAGMLNFMQHLEALGHVKGNPFVKGGKQYIAPPKRVRPRDRHLSTRDAIRVISSFGDSSNDKLQEYIAHHGLSVRELRGYNALLSGAGIEVSVALSLQVRDLRIRTREVRAPGTKSHNRDRVVRVAEWAWAFVLACAEGKQPGDRLFGTLPNRWIANSAFTFALAPLVAKEPEVFGDYWMRDGRHTYAVRAIKAGTPPIVVAKQLGHADASLVIKVYGIYSPDAVDRDYWEQKAAMMDAAERQTDVEIQEVGEAPARAARTKIAWPSVDELLAALANQPVRDVAKSLGVSDRALSKHLRKLGVDVPDGRRRGVSSPRDASNSRAS
jgi:integrase